MSTIPKKFGFIRTTLALWAGNLFPGRAGVVTDAPVGSGTSETWGWYDGAAWKYAAKRGGDEVFGTVTLTGTFTGTYGAFNNLLTMQGGYKIPTGQATYHAGTTVAHFGGALWVDTVFAIRNAGKTYLAGAVHCGAGVGFFGVTPPTTQPTVNAACTDLATCIALTNQLRTHLIACGMVQ